MLEAICFQTREVLEAMILDTAGLQHSASCPDLDPSAIEAAAAGGGSSSSSFNKSRLGSLSGSAQQQQQQQSGGGVSLKSRDGSEGGTGGWTGATGSIVRRLRRSGLILDALQQHW
jgi:hypothetical protein